MIDHWKVFAGRVELQPHPNADRVVVALVYDGLKDSIRTIIGKTDFEDGDIVVVAPKDSILPPDIRDYYKSPHGHFYLDGREHDRVRRLRLRGQESEGVVLPMGWVLDRLKRFEFDETMEWYMGHDISQLLGITRYKRPARKHTKHNWWKGKTFGLRVVNFFRTLFYTVRYA
jgi:RNA ligase (TIGR02306 family)